MRGLCLDYDLRQLVHAPTRGEYLLDLCISNIESVSVEVLSKIADHAVITARLNLAITETSSMSRTVWSFRKADWDSLKEDLMNEDWSFLDHSGPSEAAEELTKRILDAAAKHIPQRKMKTNKLSNPWLTDEIVELVCAEKSGGGYRPIRGCRQNVQSEDNDRVQGLRSKMQTENARGSPGI